MELLKIPKGGYKIPNVYEKITDKKLTAYLYAKQKNGIGIVGSIVADVSSSVDVKELKAGETFVITIITQSPFVDKDGNVHEIEIKKTVTITK